MIPRLKPYLGSKEFLSILGRIPDAVEQFEKSFARKFDCRYGVAFPYGRSAIWAFLKAVGVSESEIVMPAYTCSVVAHAAVLSGSIPVFVDIDLFDYNMDLRLLEAAITDRTRVVVATHLFGYPMDTATVQDIVNHAAKRFGNRIYVIQDCAHSFGARFKGEMVCGKPDCAVFGLNISKTITSIFGGMFTTNDNEIHQKVRTFRDENFHRQGLPKALKRIAYLFSVGAAFNESVYSAVRWVKSNTQMLNRFTTAYHLDEKIRFPPDYLDRMINLEARVGLAQLQRYDSIIEKRIETAKYYDQALGGCIGLELPPLIEGATYSHYVPRAENRDQLVERLLKQGIELGKLVDYVIPDTAPYIKYARGEYPQSRKALGQVINLPIYAVLKKGPRERIVQFLKTD
jgi:perosamine synthetase